MITKRVLYLTTPAAGERGLLVAESLSLASYYSASHFKPDTCHDLHNHRVLSSFISGVKREASLFPNP